MANKDDQEQDDEQIEISDDKLNSPPFDYGDLKGTSETEDGFESVEPEADEIDAEDIIDISDEEAQQEFEEMEREEREANKNSEVPEEKVPEEKEHAETEFEEEIQAQAAVSPIAEEELTQIKPNSTPEAVETPDPGKLDKLSAESDARSAPQVSEPFSRKIIYGSVAAALSISAIVMVLIFTFDSEESTTDTTATIDEDPFPFVSRESAIEAEQPVSEEETDLALEIVDDQEVVEDLQVVETVETEVPAIDEQIEDANLAAEDETNVAATEIAEEDPTLTEELSIAPEEIAAVDELERSDPAEEEAPAAIEEVTVIPVPEDIPTAAEEETPAPAEVISEVVSIVTEESPPVSAQVAADLVTLNESRNNFYIIVASFNSEEMAVKHSSTLPQNEETSIIIPPFEQDGKYRVAIAGYETMAEAQANIPNYKAAYGNDIWPLRYARSNTAMATLLNERTGNTYVVVSSFLTEGSAQNHVNTLTATGVEPLIIPPFGNSRSYRVTIFNYETLNAAQQALPQHKEKYGDDIWLLRY